MLILVEGRVAQCERTVEDALTALDEAEAVLERAVRRKGKEDQILTLYQPLASPIDTTDFSCGILDVAVGLVVLCSDKLSEKLRQLVTLFDFDRDLFLDKSELIAMTGTVVHLLEALGYFKVAITEEEVESSVLRALADMKLRGEGGMTHFEAKKWLLGVIAQSNYLSVLFGADWGYGELSAFVRRQICSVHAFEMGLIGVPDLK